MTPQSLGAYEKAGACSDVVDPADVLACNPERHCNRIYVSVETSDYMPGQLQ